MTTDKAALIIADYLEGKPLRLIKDVHHTCGTEITELMKSSGIALRGKTGKTKKEDGQYCTSTYWNNFLIRPTVEDAERDRAIALRMIKPEDLNPNFYK